MNEAMMVEKLKRIAEALRAKRNDPQALIDFQILVSSMAPRQRKDLLVVLGQMISEGVK